MAPPRVLAHEFLSTGLGGLSTPGTAAASPACLPFQTTVSFHILSPSSLAADDPAFTEKRDTSRRELPHALLYSFVHTLSLLVTRRERSVRLEEAWPREETLSPQANLWEPAILSLLSRFIPLGPEAGSRSRVSRRATDSPVLRTVFS